MATRLVMRLSTDNPFYVLSALLVLVGLWTSFGGGTRPEQAWGLMLGLAVYTVLLAVPACLLVRFGGVWEDVRTVLLVVVLMFLATSVTFDETLGRNPELGLRCSMGGLAFAIVLGELVKKGMRLRLPLGYKVPYLLALCLFFGYPAALVPVLDRPRSPELQWALYGFAPAAGLIALTLLPAVRKGPGYVRNNGSPWLWPFYPWALFVFLGFGVVGRAFLLCWSMHLVERQSVGEEFIFGTYFLAPFAMAVGVLLVEAGRQSGDRRVLRAGLLTPMVAVVLSAIGHREDALYQGFLREFMTTLGVSPLFGALVVAAAFYAVAALRRTPGASAWFSAVLAAFVVIGPQTLYLHRWSAPEPWPLVLLAAWQGLLAWRRGEPRRWLAMLALLSVAILVGPGDLSIRLGAAFHLGLAGLLTFGALLGGRVGRDIRSAGALLAATAGLTVVGLSALSPGALPAWLLQQYPPALAVGMACYGILVRDRPALLAALAVVSGWLVPQGWALFESLQDRLPGLGAIVLGLILLALAQLISLAKAGLLPDRLTPWKPQVHELID